jgi:hypothetical protein
MSSTSCTYVTWLCKILVSVVFSRSVCIFCSALCFVYLAPEYINRHILLKAGYIEDVWVYATYMFAAWRSGDIRSALCFYASNATYIIFGGTIYYMISCRQTVLTVLKLDNFLLYVILSLFYKFFKLLLNFCFCA